MVSMSARVSVYQLSHKFINRREDVPENARQVVYYALAVGHHVGVMDCFCSLVEIPLSEFSSWLHELPEGPGRTKLEGVLKWGEIEINCSHVGLILPLLDGCQAETPWSKTLAQSLKSMLQEPALYLMVKKLA
jgi:hydrogenase-4 component J